LASDGIRQPDNKQVTDTEYARSIRQRDADLAAMTKIVESIDAGSYITAQEQFHNFQSAAEVSPNSSFSSSLVSHGGRRRRTRTDRPNIDKFERIYDEIWGSQATINPAPEATQITLKQVGDIHFQPTSALPKMVRKELGIAAATVASKSRDSANLTRSKETIGHSAQKSSSLQITKPSATRHLDQSAYQRFRRFKGDKSPVLSRARARDLHIRRQNPELWTAIREQNIFHQAKLRKLAYNRGSGPVSKSVTRWRSLDLAHISSKQLLVDHSEYWSTEFAGLSSKYDRHLNRNSRLKDVFTIRKDDYRADKIANTLSKLDSSQKIRHQWMEYPPEEREALFANVVLHTLKHRPNSALKLLVAINVPPFGPNQIVSDSLEYILSYYLMGNKKIVPPQNVTALLEVARHFLGPGGGNISLTQRSIYLLVSRLRGSQVTDLFHLLRDHSARIHENTMLQFVHILARSGETETAMEALRILHAEGSNFKSPKIESVCATLLQKKFRTPDAKLSDSDVFATLLNLGLQPNIIFYNVLLQNALASGDSRIGWRIHDMMLDNAVEPDAHTYSILLNDAKYRMDWEAVSHIHEITVSKGIVNPYIVTDLLHAQFIRHERGNHAAEQRQTREQTLFKSMLSLYSRYFHMASLLAIFPLREDHYKDYIQQPEGTLMTPTKETLGVMLIARIHGLSGHTSSLMWFYDHFRSLVHDGHPAVAPLVMTTHVYDAIIMALGKHAKSLPYCTKVIGDMIAFSTPPAKVAETVTQSAALDSTSDVSHTMNSSSHNELQEASETMTLHEPQKDLHHAPPSVRTWSILLKAFIDNEQPRAAEKVLSMMQSRNIQPNQVTWNSLALGYARMQDIGGTVHALERSEDEGWVANEVTMKGLSWIRNRSDLVDALRQGRERRDKEAAAKIERARVSKGQSKVQRELERQQGICTSTDEVAAIEVDKLAGSINVVGENESIVMNNVRSAYSDKTTDMVQVTAGKIKQTAGKEKVRRWSNLIDIDSLRVTSVAPTV
jgi:pentatricopeptide repeat protein